MKVKTNDLKGAALNWAVCQALGLDFTLPHCNRASTDWAQGGPIMFRECISTEKEVPYPWDQDNNKLWLARCSVFDHKDGGWSHYRYWDADPLVAGMRCCVGMKLGFEVEVPEILDI